MIPISCRCMTYGRIDLLEESLYSFLNQNYEGESELVIVNDYPLQNIIFDHPKVRIYNINHTFETIGDKENFSAENCKYNTIAIWDDDDIMLNNHLQNINKFFVNDAALLHWERGVFFNSGEITAITKMGNAGIVYSKDIWNKCGKYPKENAGNDTIFLNKIKSISKNIVLAYPNDEDVSFFYYWAHRSYHMSGLGADTPDRPNIIQRHSEHIEQLRQQGKIPTGDIVLQPRWNLEYDKLLKMFLEKKQNEQI